MKIENVVYIFKTPLDSNYRNVYDTATGSEYRDFLLENFTYITFSLTSVKSRKDNNLNFELVVSGYNSNYLHDYNYMCFTSNSQLVFAFITGIESMNDGSATPSVLLKCKYDAWANNFTPDKLSASFSCVSERRCTFDTNIWRNYPSKIKDITLSQQKEIIGFFPNSVIPSGQQTFPHILPIWQRIELLEEGQIIENIVRPPTNYVKGNYNINGIPCIYIPVGAYKLSDDNSDLSLVSANCSLTFTCANSSPYVSKTIQYQVDKEYISTLICPKSSKVANNTITVNVPFNYTVQIHKIDNVSYIDIEVDNNIWFYYGNIIKSNSGSLIIAEDCQAICLADYSSFSVKEVEFSPSEQMIYDSNKRYSISVSDKNEQIESEYPFNYYSILFDDKEIPLIGDLGSNNDIIVKYDSSSRKTAFIHITNQGDKTIYIPLSNNSYLPVLELAYDEYMAQNSAKMTSDIATSILKSASSIAIGAAQIPVNPIGGAMSIVGGASSIAGTAMQTGATIYDLIKQGGKMRLGDYNSFSVPLVRDCAFIVKTSANSPSNYIREYHTKGYECFYNGDLTECRRDVFDIDCGEVELSANMSDECRNEIIEAVNRGITRWHIFDKNQNTSNARKRILKKMNRNVFNYPNSLIPVPSNPNT